MSEASPLEVLICYCASDIIRNNGANEEMLLTLYEALTHYFEPETEKRTIH